MKRLLLVIAATIPTAALATQNGAAVANTSNTEYNSPMNNANTMSNVQVNNSATPFVDIRGIRCPTAGLTLGTGAGHADTRHAQATSANAIIGFQMPIDLNGTIKRCVDAQKAELLKMRFASDFEIIDMCDKAFNAGIELDPEVFPWAVKCKGVLRKRDPKQDRIDYLEQRNAAMEKQFNDIFSK